MRDPFIEQKNWVDRELARHKKEKSPQLYLIQVADRNEELAKKEDNMDKITMTILYILLGLMTGVAIGGFVGGL